MIRMVQMIRVVQVTVGVWGSLALELIDQESL